MDYKERTLEERLDLALHYAWLLMNEVRSNQEIIKILKRDYALTEKQAEEVFENARSDYNKGPVFDEIDKKLLVCGCISLFFLCLTICAYFSCEKVPENEIATINGCIVAAPVIMERTTGKNPQHYYVIRLRGRMLPCHFSEDYYRFSERSGEIKTINTGDTISIQLLKKDVGVFYEKNDYSVIDLINIDKGNGFLVDLAYRYAAMLKNCRDGMCAALYILGAIILIFIIRKSIYFINRR